MNSLLVIYSLTGKISPHHVVNGHSIRGPKMLQKNFPLYPCNKSCCMGYELRECRLLEVRTPRHDTSYCTCAGR